MNDLYTMNNKVSRKVEYRLRKFCLPLINHLGISHFYHYLLTGDGGFASAGLNQQWHDCVFSGNDDCIPAIHHFCHKSYDQQQQIIFTQAFENEHWNNLIKIAREKYNVNLGLQISVLTEEGQEAFGFGLKSSDPFEHLAFLNNLSLINTFILAYKREFQSSYLKDNLVGLPIPIESALSKAQKVSGDLLLLKNSYCEVPNFFTRREKEVVRYLLRGCTAPEIAEKLFLSKRTVEHHLERLKEKMDCLSKSELVQKVHKFETFGYKF